MTLTKKVSAHHKSVYKVTLTLNLVCDCAITHLFCSFEQEIHKFRDFDWKSTDNTRQPAQKLLLKQMSGQRSLFIPFYHSITGLGVWVTFIITGTEIYGTMHRTQALFNQSFSIQQVIFSTLIECLSMENLNMFHLCGANNLFALCVCVGFSRTRASSTVTPRGGKAESELAGSPSPFISWVMSRAVEPL